MLHLQKFSLISTFYIFTFQCNAATFPISLNGDSNETQAASVIREIPNEDFSNKPKAGIFGRAWFTLSSGISMHEIGKNKYLYEADGEFSIPQKSSTSSYFSVESSWQKGVFGLYAKYQADLSGAENSINANKTLSNETKREKLNFGTFLSPSLDKYKYFLKFYRKNIRFDLLPSSSISYNNTQLTPNNLTKFSISYSGARLGLSNMDRFRKNFNFRESGIGISYINKEFPTFDPQASKISDSRFEGYGIFLTAKWGDNLANIRNAKIFKKISSSFDLEMGDGSIDSTVINERKSSYVSFMGETEIYIIRHFSVSFSGGINLLTTELKDKAGVDGWILGAQINFSI